MMVRQLFQNNFALSDNMASVTKITDEDANVVWESEYLPFGNVAGTNGPKRFEGLYTGKDFDPDTGLTYHWNRWRSEDGSTFISEDPARDGSNWYGYCGNNPMTFTDPTGLREIEESPMEDQKVSPESEPVQERVYQNELRPEQPVGPCFYRSLQATAEEKAGENLSLEQINDATQDLLESKAIGKEPVDDNPEPTYYVFKPEAVVKDAATRLGYPNAVISVGNADTTTDGKADFTIRKINGHFQLGDSNGKLLWDPYKFADPVNQKKYLGEPSLIRDVKIQLLPSVNPREKRLMP